MAERSSGSNARAGRVAGKVALITGAARGMGRSHALVLAQEGADLVLVDLAGQVAATPYALSNSDDLRQTADLVERTGRRVLARQADVRDQAALDNVVREALDLFGGIDIVIPNAGVVSFGRAWELTEEQWRSALDVLLTGVWHTVKAAIPAMIEAGRGGSIVIIGSVAGLRASRNIAHYVTAKHGLVGLAKALALELAEYSIRVNLVAPGSTRTDMALNPAIMRIYRPDRHEPTLADVDEVLKGRHALPVQWLEPVDVSNAVLWLASDEAQHVTGVVLPVDAGWTIK